MIHSFRPFEVRDLIFTDINLKTTVNDFPESLTDICLSFCTLLYGHDSLNSLLSSLHSVSHTLLVTMHLADQVFILVLLPNNL